MTGVKKCPKCQMGYANDSLNFCLDDGTPLVLDKFSRYDANAETLKLPNKVEEPSPKIVKREFSEQKGRVNREIIYPQITGLKNDYIQRRINTLLRRKFFPSNENLYDDEEDFKYDEEQLISFGVTLLTPSTLSIHVSYYIESDRAPHPNHDYDAFTLDLKSGYEYMYEDVFKAESDYKYVIPELITGSLKKQGDDSFDYYPFEKQEEFTFYLTKKNMVFINLYSQHIAKHIEAPIRLTTIKDLIHSEGPLFPLLKNSK